jgi:hypothetical protein
MSGIPRKVKKALAKWERGRPLGSRESKRLLALFFRTGLSQKLEERIASRRQQASRLPSVVRCAPDPLQGLGSVRGRHQQRGP